MLVINYHTFNMELHHTPTLLCNSQRYLRTSLRMRKRGVITTFNYILSFFFSN